MTDRGGERDGTVPGDGPDAIELSRDLIAVLDLEGRVLRVNTAWEKTLGFSREEIVGQDYLVVVHPEDRGRVAAEWERAAAGESLEDEVRCVARDGTVRWVQWTGTPTPGRNVLYAVGRDVTPRREAEQALRASEERYRHLFQQHPIPMAVWDPDDGRILAANDAALEQYGYSREELEGLSVARIIHPEDLPRLSRALTDLGGGLGTSLPFRHVRRDGSILEVEVTGHDVVWDGRPARVVMALDVTERRRLEEQLRQSQKMEAVGRLAGAVAHDFNNLLQAIDGYAQLLLEELPEGSAARDPAEQIHRAAGRAGELTSSLLSFSRHRVTAAAVVDVHDVIRGARPMLERLVGAGVRLDLHLSASAPLVRVDAAALEQAVVNLVLNARDSMPDGGSVRIGTRDAVTPAGSEGAGGDGALLLQVTDTGRGMDEATRRRAFEPFFTTKAAGAGTGLGLATVYRTVQQAGGTIAIETAPRAGTTVRLELPRAAPALPPAAASPRPDPPTAAGIATADRGPFVSGPGVPHEAGGDAAPRVTVLLAEDEPIVRALAERILRRGPYQVIVASDGSQALELAAAAPPDLLVTDVLMPGTSGPELARSLLAVHPDLPVLFVSGYTDEEIPEIATLGDQASFLAKPFTPDALLSRVETLLAHARARVAQVRPSERP